MIQLLIDKGISEIFKLLPGTRTARDDKEVIVLDNRLVLGINLVEKPVDDPNIEVLYEGNQIQNLVLVRISDPVSSSVVFLSTVPRTSTGNDIVQKRKQEDSAKMVQPDRAPA